MTDTGIVAPPQTKVYFGLAIELAGKTITLEPKNAIDEIKEKGIEVELPPGERVYLGTAGSSLRTIFSALDLPDEEINSFLDQDGNLIEDELPEIAALRTAARLVFEAQLYIEEFHLRIPGRPAPQLPGDAQGGEPTGGQGNAQAGTVPVEKTAYTVGISAEWQGDSGRLIESLDLKLKGVYFKVSNE